MHKGYTFEFTPSPPPAATQHERPWVGLTDVERAQIVLLNKKLTWLEQLDVFEAKLKEKNENI